MRVLHVIPSIALRTGGPATAVAQIATAASAHGCEVEIVSSDDDGSSARLDVRSTRHLPVPSHLLPCQSKLYTYTPEFGIWLSDRIERFDLLHIHGLFSYMPIIAGRVARRASIPYIITPHGIAGRYPMRQKPVRKWLSMWMLDRHLLKHAARVHMTSAREAEEFADLGLEVPTNIIPLALSKQVLGSEKRFLRAHPSLIGQDIILFLGRLNPIKNIESLIEAFAALRPLRSNSHLVIAGAGEKAYEMHLKDYAKRLGVGRHITWVGFIDQTARADVIAAAKCAALVSHSESFGMSALECLAGGLPCVLSEGVAIGDTLAEAGFAIRVKPSAKEIAVALNRACDIGSKAFKSDAIKFVDTHFSDAVVGNAMASLYNEAIESSRRFGSF